MDIDKQINDVAEVLKDFERCVAESPNINPMVRGWAHEHMLGLKKLIIAFEFWKADHPHG